MSTDPRFSLVHEPWIEVLLLDGSTAEISLRDLFTRATQIREIVGDLPTQAFAIFRIALAVVHRALDGPKSTADWERLWASESVPLMAIEEYLSNHADRFFLFDPQAPFFQVADLHTAKNKFSGLESLIGDAPTRFPYFTVRSGPSLGRLSPAEAARWLVHLQAYDVSGIKSGAVGDSRVKNGKGSPIGTGWAGAFGGLLIEGDNFWESILLHLIPRDRPMLVEFSEQDRPAWEAPPSTAAELVDTVHPRPYGPLDLYTWQSRRVRLVGDISGGVTAVLVTNGDKITPQDRHRREPMASWYRSKPQEKILKRSPVYMPRRHDPSRALWRGLGQLLPAAAPRGKADEGGGHVTAAVFEWAADVLDRSWKVRVRAVGMVYGTQNAIVDDVVDDRLRLSVAVLSQRDRDLPNMVIEAVRATDDAIKALRNLVSNLARASGAHDDALIDGMRSRAADTAYSSLDSPFRRWLAGVEPDSDVESQRFDWHDIARATIGRLADDFVREAGPVAWVGRQVAGRRVTTPEADAWFRRALFQALPPLSAQEVST